MFFPTVINDNFFDDVKSVVEFANSLKFYKPSSTDNWPGERSLNLYSIDSIFFKDVIMNIIFHYYNGEKMVNYQNASLMFHKIKPGDFGKNWYHTDNVALAAVIYLSDGDIDSGTTLLDENHQKKIIVANRKNTMISYDPRRYHAPTCYNYSQERLCLIAHIGSVIVD